MFLLPSPLSVLKLPIIRECECECEGRGKKGSLSPPPPPPPSSSRKLGREPIRGMKGGEGKGFLFPLPQALLHLFLAVAQLKTLATQVTRKVTVAKLLLQSSKTFQRPKLVFRHGVLSKKTLQSVTSLRLENRPPRKRKQNVQDRSKPVFFLQNQFNYALFRLACLSRIKGAVSRQSSLFCLISPITRP